MAENDAPELKIISMIWAREAGVRVCIYEGEQDQRVIEIDSVVDKQSRPIARATIELSKRDELANAVAKSAFEEDIELLQEDNERLRGELNGLYAKMLKGEIIDAPFAAPDAAQIQESVLEAVTEFLSNYELGPRFAKLLRKAIRQGFRNAKASSDDAVRQARWETWEAAREVVKSCRANGANAYYGNAKSDILDALEAAALRAEKEKDA